MRKLLWIAVIALCASCTCSRSMQEWLEEVEALETDSIAAADVVVEEEEVVAEEAEEVASNANVHNGHEYVDLGLPSGWCWATCNVGATSPKEYGDKFAWGEIEPKEKYTRENYKWWSEKEGYIKYNGYELFELERKDDVASVKWGRNWSMPSENLFMEHIEHCDWIKNEDSGGYEVKSKINGNSIFFPSGSYWTCMCGGGYDMYSSWYFGTPDQVECKYGYREYGHYVRPVYNPNLETETVEAYPSEEEIDKLVMPDMFKIYSDGEILWKTLKSYLIKLPKNSSWSEYIGEVDGALLDKVGFALVDVEKDPTRTAGKDDKPGLLLLLKDKPGLVLEAGCCGNNYDNSRIFYYWFSTDEWSEAYLTKIGEVYAKFVKHRGEEDHIYKHCLVDSEFCVSVDCSDNEEYAFAEDNGTLIYNSGQEQWYKSRHADCAMIGILLNYDAIIEEISVAEAEEYIRKWEDNIVTEYPFVPISKLFEE